MDDEINIEILTKLNTFLYVLCMKANEDLQNLLVTFIESQVEMLPSDLGCDHTLFGTFMMTRTEVYVTATIPEKNMQISTKFGVDNVNMFVSQ